MMKLESVISDDRGGNVTVPLRQISSAGRARHGLYISTAWSSDTALALKLVVAGGSTGRWSFERLYRASGAWFWSELG